MVDALVYIVLSIVEGLIIVFFSFGLFRIDVKDYWKEIVVTVSSISAATYYYNQHETLSQVSTLLNIIALFLALVIVFRISLLHSLYISVAGFVALLAAQLIFISGTSLVLDIDLAAIRSNDLIRYSLQIAGDILILLISLVLRKKRLWFTFVPYSPEITFKLTKSNLAILMASILGIIILSFVFKFDNLVIGTILALMCITNLIVIGIMTEKRKEA